MSTRQVKLPDGSMIDQLGEGTWKMGETDSRIEAEIAGLRHCAEIGTTLFDTAEMYGDGKSEWVIGQAIEPLRREDLYLVSKIYPWNACRDHFMSSLKKSLYLLRTDYLDLYLLHWREDADLAEVAYLMEDAKDKGLIKRWGVSNFDVQDMEDLWKVPDGDKCQINQVLYNLGSRGIEYDLMPWQRERGVPFMAYGPVGRAGDLVTQDGVSKAGLQKDPNVKKIADKYGKSVIQILLAWILKEPDVVAIPKAVGADHIDANKAAEDIVLTDEDLAILAETNPAPTEKILMEKY